MVDKKKIEELEFRLIQYIDGELNPYRRAEMQQKLADDPVLRDDLKLYRSLDAKLKTLRTGKMRQSSLDSQRAEIIAKLREGKKRFLPSRERPFLLRPFVMGSIAAAAVIVIAVTLMISKIDFSTQNPPPAATMIASGILQVSESFAYIKTNIAPPGWDEILTSVPIGVSAVNEFPPGTVIVSIGPDDEEIQQKEMGLPFDFN